jgi:hypothetical protein
MLMVVESNGVCVKDLHSSTENTSKHSNAEDNEIESKILLYLKPLYLIYFIK